MTKIMAPGAFFTGGKLNLKNDKTKKRKKRSKKSKHSKKNDIEKVKDKKNGELSITETDNDLTEVERRSRRFKSDNEARDFEKLGEKSHRERIEEFNAHLGSLTELNDIPRVSIVKIALDGISIDHLFIIFSSYLYFYIL